ncbi:RNA-directed DNA polymerase (Reverse transcriptase), Ribonuclease H [Gossypium australe]|uniref:RNA-directed DNA polymerase (Reverse transcriptase), Ribonuclease H n=1 Tax=Gossypium australe TaxID=47621 RepID=A0A5B6WPM2_9ROSI|nr:RNA-directed DNA polymerase (Reverse transcriptase), Ribonuclease H [Gossypium australe]
MYQKRMIQAYDKKEDLVLQKIIHIQKDFRGKYMPNWEGLYVVKKVFSRGALILTEMDGKNLPNPVNLNSIKKYFT